MSEQDLEAHRVEDREHRILEQVDWLLANGYRATVWRIFDEVGRKLKKSAPENSIGRVA